MSLSDFTQGLSLADELKLLNQAVQDEHTSRYLDVAAVTVMLFDIMITFDQEISLIWKAKWSFGKVLFFITRYPVAVEGLFQLVYAIDLTSPEPFCRFEAYLGIWGTLLFLIPLQIVVILRTIALWDRRRSIIVLLAFTVFTTDAAILITLSRIMHLFSFSMDPLIAPILGCSSGLAHLNPTVTIPAWSAVIIFDTVVFVLTLIRAMRTYKFSRTRLLTVLIRDGFLYYSIMLGLGISNLILLVALPTARSALAAGLTPVLRASFSIIGSRIMLNLRDALASASSGTGGVGDTMQLIKILGTSSSRSLE